MRLYTSKGLKDCHNILWITKLYVVLSNNAENIICNVNVLHWELIFYKNNAIRRKQ